MAVELSLDEEDQDYQDSVLFRFEDRDKLRIEITEDPRRIEAGFEVVTHVKLNKRQQKQLLGFLKENIK